MGYYNKNTTKPITWLLPGKKSAIGYTDKAVSDFFNIVCPYADSMNDLKMIMSFNNEEDMVKVIAILDFAGLTPKHYFIKGKNEPTEEGALWYRNYYNQVKFEKDRHDRGYVSWWSDNNDRLFNMKVVGKDRKGYIVQ